MPKLDRDRIRTWLHEHNWSITRLAEECSALDGTRFPVGTMRNAVSGLDPINPGRINLIRRVTEKYGDGIPYRELVEGTRRPESECICGCGCC